MSPVNEILVGNGAVSAIIREGATQKLQDVIVGGKAEGMQFMDDAIWEQLVGGNVSPHEAYMKAIDKSRFKPFLPPGGGKPPLRHARRFRARPDREIFAPAGRARPPHRHQQHFHPRWLSPMGKPLGRMRRIPTAELDAASLARVAGKPGLAVVALRRSREKRGGGKGARLSDPLGRPPRSI